jgi:hypothetical protein
MAFEIKEPFRNSAMSGLKPEFRKRIDALLNEMWALGYDPIVIETKRTLERQQYLFAIGRTIHREKKPVTWNHTSLHMYGKAADIISKQFGYASSVFFDALGRVAKEYGLKTLPHDRCHVQEGKD